MSGRVNPPFRVGVIASAHGVRGQVKIHSFSQAPEDLLRYPALYDKSGNKRFELTRHGVKASQLIASIKGVTDRNEAEKLKGTELFAESPLEEAGENEWVYAELIGLKAHTPEGAPYGTVTDIVNYGAGDILELKLQNGQSEMLPFTDAFVGDIEVEKGSITIFPPDYTEPEGEPEVE
ncbi:MAG: ribosome maturation factor RimM [Rickettsiales bacterium]|nr:ribosome maturation factor RimM [Rickettsiales bacterium]